MRWEARCGVSAEANGSQVASVLAHFGKGEKGEKRGREEREGGREIEALILRGFCLTRFAVK